MNNGINTELLCACASNNRGAQRQLYAVLMPYLNALCQRYLHNLAETQDVLQETFVCIFSKLHQYDEGKSAFKTWAARIAINFCLKHNERRQRLRTDEFSPLLHDVPAPPEALQNLGDEVLLLWLKAMPETLAQVFNLNIIDGFSHEEIAEILGIEPALSRQRLRRARTWLRQRCSPESLFSLDFCFN